LLAERGLLGVAVAGAHHGRAAPAEHLQPDCLGSIEQDVKLRMVDEDLVVLF
jgi:hypothetical protein